MTKEQSLQILKQLIDAAIKSGVCPNLETTTAINTAYQTIIDLLNSENK